MTNKKKSDNDRSVTTNGGSYIQGDVNTSGGDFVGRDQINSTFGDVSNSMVVIGHGNRIIGAEPAEITTRDLIKLVSEIHSYLPEAKLDNDTQTVIEGNFKVVEEQLIKPEPKKALILPSLKNIAETLTLAVTAGEAIGKLKPMLDQAISWAQQLLK